MSIPLSRTKLSLRLASALAVATTLAACQTSTINANPVTAVKNPVAENIVTKDAKPSSALTMDMSSRHEYQLENGLKIIVKEDHRAPVVMTQIWYRVGSADEPLDKGGISHVLEHMMFKGTSNVSSADYERLIA